MEPRGNLLHKHLSCATETSDKAAPKQLYHFSNQGADGRQPTEWESGVGNLSYHIPIYGSSIVFAVFSFFSDNPVVKSVEEGGAGHAFCICQTDTGVPRGASLPAN